MRSFLAKEWTITGSWLFPEPTVASNPATKNYVDNSGYATGTAGMTIAVGDSIYMSTTGTLFLTNAQVSSTVYGFVGLAATAGSLGSQISYVRPGGVASFMSGLTRGAYYYVSSTAGQIGLDIAVSGTVPGRIGRALTTSTLQVLTPDFKAIKSGFVQMQTTGVFNGIQLGFIPTRVRMECYGTSGGNSRGFWLVGNALGTVLGATSSTGSTGTDDDAIPYEMFDADTACSWEEGTEVFKAFINPIPDGFKITHTGSGARNARWVAEYDRNLSPYNP